MSISERIRELRKECHMTLEQFGGKIGLSKQSLSNIESGSRNVTERTIKDICREFNVNEQWLRTGKGTIYRNPGSFSLDEFAKSRGASGLELEILKAYFEIDPKIRRVLVDHFRSHFADASGAPDTPGELEKQCPPVEDETQAG